MNLPVPTSTLRCLPREFAAKNAQSVEVRILADEIQHQLLEMYLAFQPRNCFQGLPPIKDEVCTKWVREMLATGINLVARISHHTGPIDNRLFGGADIPVCHRNVGNQGRQECLPHRVEKCEVTAARDGRIVGHTALFPINPRKCEMLVVVCPGFQNVGIGTELVCACIDLAAELDFERIWLPVDATNVRARHVYKKCGFQYVSSNLGHELDMACEVREHCTKRGAVHQGTPHIPAPCFQLHAESPAMCWVSP